MSRWEIVEADALDALQAMPADSFDACLCDPPYGLGSREPTVEELVAYLTGAAGLNMGRDFMSKNWQVPPVAVWKEVRRVLRPGAHVVAFSGTRTQDIISIGMRAAGLEIRDAVVDWLYASGFPKSLAVDLAIDDALGDARPVHGVEHRLNSPSGVVSAGRESVPVARQLTSAASAASAAWAGHGTALKPAREPAIVARVPLDGTVANTVLTHGTGGINIDGCRIGYESDDDMAAAAAAAAAAQRLGQGNHGAGVGEYGLHDPARAMPSLQPFLDKQAMGRWPANVTFTHLEECRVSGSRTVTRPILGADPNGSPVKSVGFTRGSHAQTKRTEVTEVYECVDGCHVKLLDEQSGDRPAGIAVTRNGGGGKFFGGINPKRNAGFSENPRPDSGYQDSGGASRFFFCAKASRSEREFGCDGLPARTGAAAVEREEDSAGTRSPRAGAGRTADAVRNYHPTVKPIALMKWLATLLLPPPRADGKPRRLLIPYSGSGSELIGALRAGWDEVVGIQRISDDEERGYVAIARARLARWEQVPAHMDEGEAVREAEKPEAGAPQLGLFGGPQPTPPCSTCGGIGRVRVQGEGAELDVRPCPTCAPLVVLSRPATDDGFDDEDWADDDAELRKAALSRGQP